MNLPTTSKDFPVEKNHTKKFLVYPVGPIVTDGILRFPDGLRLQCKSPNSLTGDPVLIPGAFYRVSLWHS